MAATNPLMNLFLNFGLVAVILLGAFLVDAGVTKIGRIIAFQSYFTIILTAVISSRGCSSSSPRGRRRPGGLPKS